MNTNGEKARTALLFVSIGVHSWLSNHNRGGAGLMGGSKLYTPFALTLRL
jgi:hypothetical protein